MSGIHRPVPFLLIALLLAILVTGGCSDPDSADSPAGNQNNALTQDPFADAPADWAEFLQRHLLQQFPHRRIYDLADAHSRLSIRFREEHNDSIGLLSLSQFLLRSC